jgi:dTDP-4-amino-4,6-dideoxygalactose transaminase
MYYLLLRDLDDRSAFIEHMKAEGVHCVFHYVPLHSAPQGRKIGRVVGDMTVTEDLADRLVRLPLWLELEESQSYVVNAVWASLQKFGGSLD